MSSTGTFHSAAPGIDVYHNNAKCTEGNNIEKKNLKSGTGGKKLCSRCKSLNAQKGKS